MQHSYKNESKREKRRREREAADTQRRSYSRWQQDDIRQGEIRNWLLVGMLLLLAGIYAKAVFGGGL